jgi:dihydropteroate synthase
MFEWSLLCGVRPVVMGVVNVTPDSFSDGGRYLDPGAAVAHGLELVAAGADLLDVGGESTRPGAEPVDDTEERRRVVEVVRRLAAEAGVPVSIDTTKARVASAALEAGAAIVNDVSAGRFDPAILEVTAAAGAGYVLMHMLGEPRTMQDDPQYGDVVAEAALAADPGIGFGKTVEHNLVLLARVRDLCDRVGVPVLVGTSRKRFLGQIVAGVGGLGPEPSAADRDDATLATVVWAIDRGARIVRVHDVRPAARAVALLHAMQEVAA